MRKLLVILNAMLHNKNSLATPARFQSKGLSTLPQQTSSAWR